MHADIVAIDAIENILFLPIFLKPCLKLYPSVLILNVYTFFFVADYDAFPKPYHSFAHGIDYLAVMGNDYYGRASGVYFFQKR